MRQGTPLTDYQVRIARALLQDTDLPVKRIAERLGCSNGAILTINRKYDIRHYQGRKATWIVDFTEHASN